MVCFQDHAALHIVKMLFLGILIGQFAQSFFMYNDLNFLCITLVLSSFMVQICCRRNTMFPILLLIVNIIYYYKYNSSFNLSTIGQVWVSYDSVGAKSPSESHCHDYFPTLQATSSLVVAHLLNVPPMTLLWSSNHL